MEVCDQLYTPAALPPGRGHHYPLDGRLSGPHSWYRHSSKEKKIPAPAANLTPVIQFVACNSSCPDRSLYNYYGIYKIKTVILHVSSKTNFCMAESIFCSYNS